MIGAIPDPQKTGQRTRRDSYNHDKKIDRFKNIRSVLLWQWHSDKKLSIHFETLQFKR